MFANLTYEDKVAFFDLLDEYFSSRPHLLGGGGGGGSASASPTSATASGSRTLPPMAPASSGRTMPPVASPPARSPSGSGGGGGGFGFGGLGGGGEGGSGSGGGGQGGEKPDMATKLLMGGIKMGTSGARTGLGMLSKNQAAMDALGRVGAAAIVNQAHGQLNKAGGKQGQAEQASPTSPVPPQAQPPTQSYSSLPAARGAPPKRTPAPPQPVEMAQAQAMYDYEPSDAGDLGVQSGQMVYIVQKTSADWWTCEDASGRKGLVPSAYLKET